MRRLSDPLVPMLGVAVTVVVTGAVLFVFVPRISVWFEPSGPAPGVPEVERPDAPMPVWVSRSLEGCALLLEPLPGGMDPFARRDGEEASSDGLQEVLEGGPYHLLLLTVCNFEGPDVLHLELPGDGLKGARGATLKPVSAVLRPDIPAALRPILAGLGASAVADVPRGSSARMLLVAKQDPTGGESFAGGGLLFERREVQLVTLTGWRESPDWKAFQDF